MNREVFSKKTETPYHPGVLCDSQEQIRTYVPLVKRLTQQGSTPKKTDEVTPPDEEDRLADSHFSSRGRLYRMSPHDERDVSYMSVAQNISYFIDSQSSGTSEVSFRSDIAKPDRFNSSSTHYEKGSKTPSTYPGLADSAIRVFLQAGRFCDPFVHTAQEFLDGRYKTLSMKEHWNFEKLFAQFAAMPFSHPFREREPIEWKGMETYEGVMDRWIYDYSRHQRLILSFDFMMSHTSLLLVLIFYWVKLLNCPDDPLLSMREVRRIREYRCLGLRNLLDIMRDYAYYRSRELRSNLIAIKLLNEFYEHAKEALDMRDVAQLTVRQACVDHHSKLSDVLALEKAIRARLEDGRDCDHSHLRQVMINYEEKDKMLQDNADDLADLFCELTRRLFYNCPLSRLYQVGEEDLTKKEIADKFTTMSCWLQMLVVGRLKRSRGSGWIGIEYLGRYLELCRQFMRRKNYENLLLFATATMNLRDCLPKLWNKFLERSPTNDRGESPESELRQMLNLVETMGFGTAQQLREPIVHSNLKILRVIEHIKEKYKKDKELINLNFHENIQEYARRVLQLRKNLESDAGTRSLQERSASTNRTIKLNLNYRFLSHQLYELLQQRDQFGPKAYDQYRSEARRLDESIHFPSFLFAPFY